MTRTTRYDDVDLRSAPTPIHDDGIDLHDDGRVHDGPDRERSAAVREAGVIDLFGSGDGHRQVRYDQAGYEVGGPIESDDPDVLLEEAIYLVSEARALPMSTTVKVNRDDLLDLLEAARECLPTELAAARALLRRRDEVIERAEQEAAEILDQAHHQASRMVERTEIVRAADTRARQIVQAGKDQASRLRAQADDYCDEKLAYFENVLDRTAKVVADGRAKLAGLDRRPDVPVSDSRIRSAERRQDHWDGRHPTDHVGDDSW